MIQTKQELIASLEAQNEGAQSARDSLQNDHFNAPARAGYESAMWVRTGLINQLKRELEEEKAQGSPDVLPELPEGCLETGRTIVRSYLTPEGASQYTIHTRGRRDKFDVIGGLEVAKYEILANWEDLDA